MLFQHISPMWATMRRAAWDDADWLFEPKYDGFSLQLHTDGDRLAVFTRPRRCVTDQFPELQTVREALRAGSVILDGELGVLSERTATVLCGHCLSGPPHRRQNRSGHRDPTSGLRALRCVVVNGKACTVEPLVPENNA